jgi:hypothetical protein
VLDRRQDAAQRALSGNDVRNDDGSGEPGACFGSIGYQQRLLSGSVAQYRRDAVQKAVSSKPQQALRLAAISRGEAARDDGAAYGQ